MVQPYLHARWAVWLSNQGESGLKKKNDVNRKQFVCTGGMRFLPFASTSFCTGPYIWQGNMLGYLSAYYEERAVCRLFDRSSLSKLKSRKNEEKNCQNLCIFPRTLTVIVSLNFNMMRIFELKKWWWEYLSWKSELFKMFIKKLSRRTVNQPTVPCLQIWMWTVQSRLCWVYSWHLHQRVQEHNNTSSSIGKHFRDKHSLAPKDLTNHFSVLRKCTNKLDCLFTNCYFPMDWDYVLRFLICLYSTFSVCVTVLSVLRLQIFLYFLHACNMLFVVLILRFTW